MCLELCSSGLAFNRVRYTTSTILYLQSQYYVNVKMIPNNINDIYITFLGSSVLPQGFYKY